ncbi:MAG: protein kinase [Minicystis sp.]
MIKPRLEEHDDNLGTRCGAFVLTRFIAAGGFSRVYCGLHEATRKVAAIKVLDTIQAKRKDAEARFLRESKLMAAIEHPNIVRFVDAGVSRDKLWLAMELLDGQTLRDHLAESHEGRLAETEALRIAYEAACGIAHAQRIGAIHRDIKPENIFIIKTSEVKVLDFGIAKLYGWGIQSTNRLKDGVLGTPSYMSPEQISGGQVGFPSDVFQLGLVLYEMLSGRYAFSDESGGIPSPRDLCLLLSHGTPPPLPEGAVSPAVARLLTQALEKEPGDRFPTMAAFAETLWDVLVDLREEEAALGVAVDHRNPASSEGRPLGPEARRVYAPMQTPPSERPPAIPSESVRLRSDLMHASAKTERVTPPPPSRSFLRLVVTERMDSPASSGPGEDRGTLPAAAPRPGRAPHWLPMPGAALPERTRELPASSLEPMVADAAALKLTTKRRVPPPVPQAPFAHRARAWLSERAEETPTWLRWMMAASASSTLVILLHAGLSPSFAPMGPAHEAPIPPVVSASKMQAPVSPVDTVSPVETAVPSSIAGPLASASPSPALAPPVKVSAAPALPRPARPAAPPIATATAKRPPSAPPSGGSQDIF